MSVRHMFRYILVSSFLIIIILFFFFFQAEDGIRDLTVTGVQTCALPISNAGAAHAFLTTYLAQNERERIDSLPDLQAACAALQQANAGHPLLPAALGTLRAEIARLELARVRLAKP